MLCRILPTVLARIFLVLQMDCLSSGTHQTCVVNGRARTGVGVVCVPPELPDRVTVQLACGSVTHSASNCVPPLYNLLSAILNIYLHQHFFWTPFTYAMFFYAAKQEGT